jgi:Domain of unknown function (DUF1707)
MADPELRASDEDRDRVAAEIREHFAQGRLDRAELDDRLKATFSAKTVGQLDTLTSDLPELSMAVARVHSELALRRAKLSRELVQQTGGALVPFVVCTLVWVLGGAEGSFWPIWALIFPIVVLARDGWRLFGPAPELDRVADSLAERRNGRPKV